MVSEQRREHEGVKVFVFIDASNLWQALKVKGRFLDYAKLTLYLRNQFSADGVQVYYYTAYPAEGTRDYSLDSKHKFYTYLKKALGFVVRKKELKRITVTTAEGVAIQEKGNMDVEMAIDAVSTISQYDIAVLFTGDSDFLALVKYIRSRGKKVYIFSSPNNVSTELRTGTDGYFDVAKIDGDIWRQEIKHRDQK
ncbi:NYN domain-containing protein [bacterium]|nr:MAG: NYN domain-containing protein [bacterium]